MQEMPLREKLYVQGFGGCHVFLMTRSILNAMMHFDELENIPKDMSSL
jgi:hypothetical protein